MTDHIARDHTIGDDTVAENEGSGNVEFGFERFIQGPKKVLQSVRKK